MVAVQPGIIAADVVMAHPLAVAVNVRRVGMIRHVAEIAIGLTAIARLRRDRVLWLRDRSLRLRLRLVVFLALRLRPARRNIASAHAFAALLGLLAPLLTLFLSARGNQKG
jgi:hypothetical protein